MKSFFLTLAGVFAFALPVAHAQTAGQTINWDASTFGASKNTVKADGIDNATVSVTIKNLYYGNMEGLTVQLVSDRGDNDEIIANNATTNSSGRASFLVRSLRNGTSTLTAIVNGQTFPNKTVTITFEQGLQLRLPVGSLIKIPDDNDVKTLSDTAVYYYASNGKRYVFPNEKTYFTWYNDFNNVQVIPIDQMALIPIGGNVTYRPASKLVKFQTDPKVYLPTKGGVLRWAQTEDIVRTWFGSDWNTQVDDISEAFYVNYKFGDPIAGPYDVSLQVIRDTASTVNENLGLGRP
ncbi:MAG TPA: invasin domain 3-containing protein [Verrucomicrobiae bacterium]|nr:invasin domain 3-containing protein [Verrucomicrobiae bacterium]